MRLRRLKRAEPQKNPDAGVQSEACLALAQGIRQEADMVKRVQKDEKTAKVYEQYYGKEKVEALVSALGVPVSATMAPRSGSNGEG